MLNFLKFALLFIAIGWFLGFVHSAFTEYPWPVALLASSSWGIFMLLCLLELKKSIDKED